MIETRTGQCYIREADDSSWNLTEKQFHTSFWQSMPGYSAISGGRGGSSLIEFDNSRAVLRRYYRGGAVARVLSDQYFWMGKSLSRPWREWNILELAQKLGLPVPRPIGACICRSGLFYRAALITSYLEDTETLTARLQRKKLSSELWYSLGVLFKRMQAEGIRHADLNSDNVLIDSQDRFYLIDFDKARVMKRLDDWQWRPLYRFQRSIEKRHRKQTLHATENDWQSLMDGYQS